MSQSRIAGLLIVMIGLVAGCAGATPALTPSGSVTTAIQGWERWLRLEWTAQPGPAGQAIDGYVYSNYGSPISGVTLLAQGLDSAGSVVGQRVAWVPGVVPGLQGAYFRIGSMPPAAQYRVTVWAFEILETHSYE